MNGIQNELIEWSGPTSSGKTQLCHLLTISTLASSNKRVIYIDSGGQFSSKRIKQLMNGDLFIKCKLSNFLERIIVVKCYKVQDLEQVLEELKYIEFEDGIALLIIDSFASIVQSSSRIKLLGKTLQILSNEYPIIIVNNAVNAEKDFITPGARLTQTKPALGSIWKSIPKKRIYFTPSHDRLLYMKTLLSNTGKIDNDYVLSIENSKGDAYKVTECVVEQYVKEKILTCKLYIGKYDILAF
jgi:RAD51-like protein 3